LKLLLDEILNMTELHDEGFTLIFAGANTVADTLLMGHWHLMGLVLH
jgi:cytochrome P450